MGKYDDLSCKKKMIELDHPPSSDRQREENRSLFTDSPL